MDVKLNGVVDQYFVVGLLVGDGNFMTVEVTAEDRQTKQTYTVTVARRKQSHTSNAPMPSVSTHAESIALMRS